MFERVVLMICSLVVGALNCLFFFEDGHHFVNAFAGGIAIYAGLLWLRRIVRVCSHE